MNVTCVLCGGSGPDPLYTTDDLLGWVCINPRPCAARRARREGLTYQQALAIARGEAPIPDGYGAIPLPEHDHAGNPPR